MGPLVGGPVGRVSRWCHGTARAQLSCPLTRTFLAGDGEPACKRDSVGRLRDPVAIHLCGLPGDVDRAGHPLLGLAPGGGYRAARVTPDAGALLPHRFTLTCAALPQPSAVCSLLP